MRGPERLRYAGLTATALLAAGAYGAGAHPGGDPAPRFVSAWLAGTGVAYRMGLLAWLLGLALLGLAWWRLAALLPDLAPRWLLTTGALWALPLLFAPPLASRDGYAYACQGALWVAGHDPYATGVAGGDCPWLAAVPSLWHDTPTPYGPLAVALSGGAAAIARALPIGDPAQLLVAIFVLRLLAVAGIALAAGSAIRLARAAGGNPTVAAWLGALSPLVAIHAVSGAHNDALLAGLTLAALAVALPAAGDTATARAGGPVAAADVAPGGRGAGVRRAVVAGAVLGLAVAVKVTAIVALPFAVLLLARHTRLGTAAAATVAGLVGAFSVTTLATGLDLGWLGALQGTGSLVQWTSLPTAVGMALGYPLRALGWSGGYDVAVTLARAAGLLVLAVAGAALLRHAWRTADRSPRTVLLCCGAAFAAVALLSPVFYPWYALTPLAILAAATVDARALRWLAAAAIALSALVLPQGLGIAVLTKLPGAYLITAALAALAWWYARRRRAAA